MSTNCIWCLQRDRTGNDLMCDHCRQERAQHRLHAAAPALLEACKEVLEDLRIYQVEDINALTVERVSELMVMLNTAIAAAKGGTHGD